VADKDEVAELIVPKKMETKMKVNPLSDHHTGQRNKSLFDV
jgi:hypothetical protein